MTQWNEIQATNAEPPLRIPSLKTFHRRVKALPREVVLVGRGLIQKRRARRIPKTSWDSFGAAESVAVDSANWFTSRPVRVAVNDLGAMLPVTTTGKREYPAVVAGHAPAPMPQPLDAEASEVSFAIKTA